MFRKYYKLAIIPISLFAYKNLKNTESLKCYFCSYICVTDTKNCLYCLKDIINKKS